MLWVWGIGLKDSNSTKTALFGLSVLNAIVFFVNAGMLYNRTESDLLGFIEKSEQIEQNTEKVEWAIRQICSSLESCAIQSEEYEDE